MILQSDIREDPGLENISAIDLRRDGCNTASMFFACFPINDRPIKFRNFEPTAYICRDQ